MERAGEAKEGIVQATEGTDEVTESDQSDGRRSKRRKEQTK
ncbi:hypothetical protein [Lysinibacillus xylanilyticus]|nr:hypothetical protein [Lysinibacillus xylanilyticus]